MTRTPEQRDADDALTAAIERVLQAYDDGDAWMLTEYVVVTAQHRYDDEGESLTAVGALFRDGDVPTHRALGLLDYGATRLRHRIAQGDV